MGCDLPVAVGSNPRHEFDLCNLPFPRWDLPSYSYGTRNRDPSEVAGHHFLVHSIDVFIVILTWVFSMDDFTRWSVFNFRKLNALFF